MADYSEDYLLNKRVKIFQPTDGYRASTDAVLLAAAVNKIKKRRLCSGRWIRNRSHFAVSGRALESGER